MYSFLKAFLVLMKKTQMFPINFGSKTNTPFPHPLSIRNADHDFIANKITGINSQKSCE